ncbi:MAG: protease inhibitor I42 family protein [Beijerinckiaceae bacterium]
MFRQFLLVAVSLLVCRGALAEDHALQLSLGEREPIVLEENPTTGYVWRIGAQASSNLAILRIEDGGFSPPGSGSKIGAPGIHRWTIAALSKGRASLTFVYQRAWEQTSVKIDRWSIEVR